MTNTTGEPAVEAGDTPAGPTDGATTPVEPTDGATPVEPTDSGTTPIEPTDSGTTPIEPAGDDVPAEPPDGERWSAFGPWQPPPPGPLRRAGAAVGRELGRFFSHEWTLVVLGGLVLAVVMTWPTLEYPHLTLPQDLGDPTLVAWILAWPGHVLLTDPAGLWHTNAFFPDGAWSLAFTDSLLGYAPFALIGDGMAAALVRYNVIYVLAFALAFIGAYALARQLGADRPAALVAAVAFAYAPWRLVQAGHLHVLSTGGIVLALAMLARGHGWSLRRPHDQRRVRPGWIVAGWLVAAWQVSIGFGIGLIFGYVLAGIVLVAAVGWLVRWVVRRRPPEARVVGANLVGGTIFGAITLLMALPYLTVVDLYPHAKREIAEVAIFSPPLRGFLTAPPESWLWGSLHEGARATPISETKGFWTPEMALLPGFALLALAVAGLFFSIWRVRTRVLLAAGVVASVVLGMGTEAFDGRGYELLYDHLPGWDALRTPGRLIIWTTLLLGLLAAGAVSDLVDRSRELALSRGFPRPGGWLKLAVLLPAVLVAAEGIGETPNPAVPPPPAALATVDGPILVLPTDHATDTLVMLWATDRFVPMVNGGSGFAPPSQEQTRQAVQSFPDQASVDYLRSLGVSTVVVLPERVVGTPWERALDSSGFGLGLVREDTQGAILFHLESS